MGFDQVNVAAVCALIRFIVGFFGKTCVSVFTFWSTKVFFPAYKECLLFLINISLWYYS